MDASRPLSLKSCCRESTTVDFDAYLQHSYLQYYNLRAGNVMNQFDTHEVFNQAPPFENVNLLRCDPALREGLAREGAAWALDRLDALGAQLGRAEVLDLARLANTHGPRLVSFDRAGRRVDEVEFHPAWHELM